MKLVTYDGVEHKLSERDWRRVLRRFDAGSARLNAFDYYFIQAKSICSARSFKCIRCPLRDPHKKTNSCTYWFTKIIGDHNIHKIHFRDSGVFWDKIFDADVREALAKITDIFTNAQTINRAK
jgi:hypothetical protein